ncbi:MAG: universal stress protein [Jiangellaceae bacterium]
MAHLVIGVDGSQESTTALTWAAAEAQRQGAALVIIYGLHMPIVSVPLSGSVVLPPTDELEKYARNVLDEAAAAATTTAPGLEVRTELELRPPADALLAASADAELVVVGSRGLSSLGSVILGSVSARVAAGAACPTVVIPADAAESTGTGPIVVGIDGSAHSDAALTFAVQRADRLGTTVVAIHAYTLSLTAVPIIDPELAERLGQQQRREAEEVVTEALERAGVADRADLVSSRIVVANAGEALTEAGSDAAMTVVGSRGRGGFIGMLLGSVSQAVLHRAHHPVVVVRAANR